MESLSRNSQQTQTIKDITVDEVIEYEKEPIKIINNQEVPEEKIIKAVEQGKRTENALTSGGAFKEKPKCFGAMKNAGLCK